MIETYKIIVTETIKIEIYVSFINIHLKRLLQNSIINRDVKHLINAIETAMQRIRKNLMSKKESKIKIMNDFTVSKETLKTKAFKRNKDNVQSILHRSVVNELFKNDYRD